MASDYHQAWAAYANACPLLAVPVELIGAALAFLEAAELDLARGLCSWLCQAGSTDALWQPLCARRWAGKSRAATAPWRDPALALPWRARFVGAELGRRRCHFEAPAELHALAFDFRFRSHPEEPQGRAFRLNADGRVSGHPNGLTYDWELLDGGRGVRLGQYPAARVRRLASWGWALCNPNIVCMTVEPGVDGEADPGAPEAAEADGQGAAGAGAERPWSAGAGGGGGGRVRAAPGPPRPTKAEANKCLFDEDGPRAGDDLVQVTLPDGSAVAVPAFLYRLIVNQHLQQEA